MMKRGILAVVTAALLTGGALNAFSGDAASPRTLRVAVVDTGLDLSDPRFASVLCRDGHKDFTGEGIKDSNGHGTHVAGIIQGYASARGYCLEVLKYYREKGSGQENLAHEIEAFRYAVAQGVDIINFSGGGPSPSEAEREVILRARGKTIFVVAAGNEGSNIGQLGHEFYPASYHLPNIVAVGALDWFNRRLRSSNWGAHVEWEVGESVLSTLPDGGMGRMSGTSMAAAIRTGRLIRARLGTE